MWAAIVAALTGIVLVALASLERRARTRDRVRLRIDPIVDGEQLRLDITNGGNHGTVLRRGYVRWGEDPFAEAATAWRLPVDGRAIPAGGEPHKVPMAFTSVIGWAQGNVPRWVGIEDVHGNVARAELPQAARDALSASIR
jgi:hypothetical protein